MRELQKLQEIFAEKLAVKPEQLSPELSLDMLLLDSLDFLELTVCLEQAFDTQLDDQRLAGCDSLAELAEAIALARQP